MLSKQITNDNTRIQYLKEMITSFWWLCGGPCSVSTVVGSWWFSADRTRSSGGQEVDSDWTIKAGEQRQTDSHYRAGASIMSMLSVTRVASGIGFCERPEAFVGIWDTARRLPRGRGEETEQRPRFWLSFSWQTTTFQSGLNQRHFRPQNSELNWGRRLRIWKAFLNFSQAAN